MKKVKEPRSLVLLMRIRKIRKELDGMSGELRIHKQDLSVIALTTAVNLLRSAEKYWNPAIKW